VIAALLCEGLVVLSAARRKRREEVFLFSFFCISLGLELSGTQVYEP
jgi:hypothetical protein